MAQSILSLDGKWSCLLAPENELYKVKSSGLSKVTFANSLATLSKSSKALKAERTINKLKLKKTTDSKVRKWLKAKILKLSKKIDAQLDNIIFIKHCRDGEFNSPGENPPPSSNTPTPSPSSTPPPNPSLPAPLGLGAIGGDSQVSLAWASVTGANSYNLYWQSAPGVTIQSGTKISNVSSPYIHTGRTNGTTYYYIVTAQDNNGESPPSNEATASAQDSGTSQYDPPWANTVPTQIIAHSYNTALTSAQNGSALKTAILALQPGSMLEVAGGTYDLPQSNFNLNLHGAISQPIWIVAKAGEFPLIRMPTTSKNIIDAGSSISPAQYLVLQGLSFTGGSAGIRLHHASNVWIDQCKIFGTADAGITTNTQNTDHIYITRNEIYNTAGYGEGMYLGANNGAVKMHSSIIALNHVHHTGTISGSVQGDGIELKQGSYNNLIAENIIHDNHYPSILVYGTAGAAPNVIERNICFNSGDNTVQVQGDAIVRNNLIMNGAQGFHSRDHQGTVQNLTVVHNTIINSGKAVSLSNWANKPNIIFANNVAYSQNSNSIQANGGAAGAIITGNVVFGAVSGISSGYIFGNGLSDFEAAQWNASTLDATPSSNSAIIGSANLSYLEPIDISGTLRQAPHESGAFDRR